MGSILSRFIEQESSEFIRSCDRAQIRSVLSEALDHQFAQEIVGCQLAMGLILNIVNMSKQIHFLIEPKLGILDCVKPSRIFRNFDKFFRF